MCSEANYLRFINASAGVSIFSPSQDSCPQSKSVKSLSSDINKFSSDFSSGVTNMDCSSLSSFFYSPISLAWKIYFSSSKILDSSQSISVLSLARLRSIIRNGVSLGVEIQLLALDFGFGNESFISSTRLKLELLNNSIFDFGSAILCLAEFSFRKKESEIVFLSVSF